MTNPNTTTPFNHRSHFTKLKRHIHQKRVAALAATMQMNGEGTEDGSNTASMATSNSASKGLADEVEEKAPTYLIQQTVVELQSIHTQLHQVMQHHRYRLARVYILQLQRREHKLRRLLLQYRRSHPYESSSAAPSALSPQTMSTEHATISATPHVDDTSATSPAIYHNFHPTTTALGIGRHPESLWVDQRTGRYPAQLDAASITNMVKDLSCTVNQPEGENTEPHLASHLVPVSRLGCSMAEADAKEEKPLSRRQQHQRFSLFVGVHCSNIIVDRLDDAAFTLLQSLYQEQRELRQRQPLQFKARQRYVVGLHETLKLLRSGRVKMVLLATDLELRAVSQSSISSVTAASPSVTSVGRKKTFGSLEEAVQLVLSLCDTPWANVAPLQASTIRRPPCITCMSRQRFSYALYAKGSRISCVGILHAEKSRPVLTAVMLYGRYLTKCYKEEMASMETLSRNQKSQRLSSPESIDSCGVDVHAR